jgi:site-specific DNA-methyltransferase (adenine-specific)
MESAEVSERFQLMFGDCLDRLKELPADSVSAVVTDPPYGMEFMGKEWDSFRTKDGFRRSKSANDAGRDNAFGRLSQKGPEYYAGAFQAYMTPIFAECLRVLKPGGHLLAFGGSRTYHRLASAVEDAGFEIRDQIMWLYGQGFPKSLDVSKAIDATTLYGGSDTSRIKEVNKTRPGEGRARSSTNNNGLLGPARGPKITKDDPATPEAAPWNGWGTTLKPAHEPIVLARKPLIGTVAANVLQHGTGGINIDDCRVEHVTVDGGNLALNPHLRATINGGNGGHVISHEAEPRIVTPHPQGRWPANVIHDGSEEVLTAFPNAPGQLAPTVEDGADQENNVYGKMKRGGRHHVPRVEQTTSAARFFYCAKATKKDRGEGNSHPTVKPTELMRYLLRLITPPGGTVLDPFMGSGSTGKAAALEGFHFVGIEKERAYFDIAKQRIDAEYALAV